MNAYRVTHEFVTERPNYFGTMADAHKDAKEHGKHNYLLLRIELVSVNDDKAGVLALLNGDQPGEKDVLKTWALTDRGGLKEVPNGE